MTKEGLINKILNYYDAGSNGEIKDVHEMFDEFFKDKVIIQRGENRHKYADVLHELAEDTTKDVEIATHHCNNIGRDEYIFDSVFRIPNNPLRIKPKEPIYEWQYAAKDGVSGEWTITRHFTDEEAKYIYCADAEKIEKTKRERKQ